MLLFQPSASEVHAQAGKWFEDEEIYGWFASNLHRVREPSLRHYVRAKELKAAGMDWTEVLAAEEENPRARLVTEILASPAYDSTAARVKAFVEQGEGAGRPSSTTASSAMGAGMRLGSAKDTTSVQGRYRGGGVGAATSRVDNSAALLFNSRCK